MHAYTIEFITKTLLSSEIIGQIPSSSYWTSQWLAWENQENSKIQRELVKENRGYEVLQGQGFHLYI